MSEFDNVANLLTNLTDQDAWRQSLKEDVSETCIFLSDRGYFIPDPRKLHEYWSDFQLDNVPEGDRRKMRNTYNETGFRLTQDTTKVLWLVREVRTLRENYGGDPLAYADAKKFLEVQVLLQSKDEDEEDTWTELVDRLLPRHPLHNETVDAELLQQQGGIDTKIDIEGSLALSCNKVYLDMDTRLAVAGLTYRRLTMPELGAYHALAALKMDRNINQEGYHTHGFTSVAEDARVILSNFGVTDLSWFHAVRDMFQ